MIVFYNNNFFVYKDNIDTRSALDSIREFIGFYNIYAKNSGFDAANLILVRDVASYITNLMQIFGVISKTNSIGFPVPSKNYVNNVNFSFYNLIKSSCMNLSFLNNFQVEEILMPHVTVLAEFRHSVRQEARLLKASKILQECDKLRDNVLPSLGVRLEDQEGKIYFVFIIIYLIEYIYIYTNYLCINDSRALF